MPEYNTATGERITDVNQSHDKLWIKREFSASAMLFWIKGNIAVDYRAVRVMEQNTALGLLPAGNRKKTIPLNTISDVTISTEYKVGRFVLGVFLAIIGLVFIQLSFLTGLILILIGAGIFLNGILTRLDIEKSGNTYEVSVPFFDRTAIQEVQSVIEQALNSSIDKTDLNLHH